MGTTTTNGKQKEPNVTHTQIKNKSKSTHAKYGFYISVSSALFFKSNSKFFLLDNKR